MRNNSGRFNAPVSEGDDISTQLIDKKRNDQPSLESPFSYSTPTEFVDLPSHGIYYPVNHPLHNAERVEIRFMTAKDILTSKSLIKQGIAIDRMVDNIVVNKSIKSKDMLSGDKNAILIAARSTAFGSDYKTKVNCPSCGNGSEYEFDLQAIQHKQKPDLEELKVEETEDGTFVFELPRTKAEVEIKILTSKEEAELMQTIEKRAKKGLPESPTTSLLSSIIVSINGVVNQSQIYMFCENMPSQDSRFIKSIYQKIVPGLDMKQEFNCSYCSYNQEVEIPITVDFFWSER
jgi:hypothetical protein